MQYPWARVGQKVVYSPNNPIQKGYGDETTPAAGNVYTIRHVRPAASLRPGLAILLEEVVNPIRPYYCSGRTIAAEYGFHIRHFRPVFKTDISIFTDMLKTKELEKA